KPWMHATAKRTDLRRHPGHDRRNESECPSFAYASRSPGDTHDSLEADHWADRLAADQLCRGRDGCRRFGTGRHFLPAAREAVLGTALVGVRTGVVGTLCTNGHRRLAGLA